MADQEKPTLESRQDFMRLRAALRGTEQDTSWRYQNGRDEARRLQRSGSSRRIKKEADSQDLLSFQSCRRRDEFGLSEKDAGRTRGDG